jgi:metallo-beta-lactamase class B
MRHRYRPIVHADPFECLRQGCERPWEIAVEPFTVAQGVHYVGNGWVGAYLIETSEGLVLIDATMQPQVYLVLESIRRLGFDTADVRLILLSHAHYDHCGGIRAVVEETGARVKAAREDVQMMRERPELVFTMGWPCGPFEVDDFYSDDRPVVLGDTEIRTVHTPGHTPGTTSFFFERPGPHGRALRCGLHGGLGLNTLTDEFLREHRIAATVRDDFLAGLLRVRDLPVDITLGSHPGQTGMFELAERIGPDHNPFIDPTVWPRLIDQRIRMVRALMARPA